MQELVIVVVIVASYLVEAAHISRLFLSVAVQAPNRRRSAREQVVDFDAFGNVPKLEEAYSDLEENALPIVGIIFRGENASSGEVDEGILLAYGTLPAVSQEQGKKHVTESTFLSARTLQRRIGLQVCASLGSDSQKVLITGRTGDARAVMRLALQVSSNHTFDYDSSASGKYIAEKLGQFLQRTTMGGESLLRMHVFIASADKAHPVSLHSVDAGGNIVELAAGNAGRHKKLGGERLEDSYRGNLTLAEAKELARQIINPPDKTQGIREGGDEENVSHSEDEEEELKNAKRTLKSNEKEEEDEDEGEDVLENREMWPRLPLDVGFEILTL